MSTYHALLTDSYALDAPIYLFSNRLVAERALCTCGSGSPCIVNCSVEDLFTGAAQGCVFLALTLEDSGVRIHAAFRSMSELRSYMLDHVSESRCVSATGWLEPTFGAHELKEEFQPSPETRPYLLGAA